MRGRDLRQANCRQPVPVEGKRLVRHRFQGGASAKPKASRRQPAPAPPARVAAGMRVRGQLIRRYFVTGLLIWVPLAITAWVLSR